MGWRLLALALFLATMVYWPGLHGGWLFDDYPNIVDNKGVQPATATLPALIRAALSSPASDLKRPLASLSFAANFLLTGLDPFWMKLTNLAIHLSNGVLFFLLARSLTRRAGKRIPLPAPDVLAAWIAGCWLILPINLTGVLYIVQRMESLANVFVLVGLLGYMAGRERMQLSDKPGAGGLIIAATSLVAATGIGLMAKETAVMLPLYAFLIEWLIFGFRSPGKMGADKRVVMLFGVTLWLPMLVGGAWLIPALIRSDAWTTRDFTLGTRLLTEARVVVDYIVWTLAPIPSQLSFYHDDYEISSSLLSPPSTLVCLCLLAALTSWMLWLRKRRPLASLGIALFLGAQLLTATILPLELVYEHRNYFASFGLLLTFADLLYSCMSFGANPDDATQQWHHRTPIGARLTQLAFMAVAVWWTVSAALTAYAWGDPLRLSLELASRGPDSPRAQYELGRTYIIYSGYDPSSLYTRLAYAPLERAAHIPSSSILPLQALIFMNSRMHLPLDPRWWDTMTKKLTERRPGVQDESSLSALTHCAIDKLCDLPPEAMTRAYQAALSHPTPTARLQAMYGEYAWSALGDRELALTMMKQASDQAPREPAYLMTLIRMEIATGHLDAATTDLQRLRSLSIGGSLDASIGELSVSLAGKSQAQPPGL